MRHLAVLLRLVVAVVALAQPLLPGAAAVLDGTLSERAGTARAAAHVEDARHGGCPFVHDGECGVCQYLAVVPRPETPRSEVAATPSRIAMGAARRVASGVQERARPPSRGPPLA